MNRIALFVCLCLLLIGSGLAGCVSQSSQAKHQNARPSGHTYTRKLSDDIYVLGVNPRTMLTSMANMISKFHQRATELFPDGYSVLLLEESHVSYPGTRLTAKGVEGIIVSKRSAMTEEKAKEEVNRIRGEWGLLPLKVWSSIETETP